MRQNGDLYIEEDRPTRNARTGRFLKGCPTHNKGRSWSEWMSKKGQKNSRKGWENLKKYRPKTRSPLAGNQPKQVVAVSDSGKWLVFPSVEKTSEWLGGINQNVSRCCRENAKHLKNTDHRYMGIRFYFETDDNWMTKVKNDECNN